MDNITAAKILIKSLDLTSLNPNDSAESISNLCCRASTPYGNSAAICVYSEFIPIALKNAPQGVQIATVVNFPEGGTDLKLTEKEIKKAIKAGADEIDAVLPYHNLLNGDEEFKSACDL